ncbi:hypothetical protein D3C85_1752930 [compost metagenome]
MMLLMTSRITTTKQRAGMHIFNPNMSRGNNLCRLRRCCWSASSLTCNLSSSKPNDSTWLLCRCSSYNFSGHSLRRSAKPLWKPRCRTSTSTLKVT